MYVPTQPQDVNEKYVTPGEMQQVIGSSLGSISWHFLAIILRSVGRTHCNLR